MEAGREKEGIGMKRGFAWLLTLLALLLGAWMNGLPFFSRRVKMPEINRER